MNDNMGIIDNESKSAEEKKKYSDEEIKQMREELYAIFDKIFAVIKTDPKHLYMISTRGIGDFILAGGLSYALQKAKGKEGVVMITHNFNKDSGIYFPNVVGFITVPVVMGKAFSQYCYGKEHYEGDNYIYANIRRESGEHIWNDYYSMLDRFKSDALGLPLDTPFLAPLVDDISDEQIANIHRKYIIDKERTIILLPHANTFKDTLKEEFWLNMAKRLKEKNYIVYTNVAKEEKVIEGTEPIRLTFPELYYITDKVKCFIGLNSGVFVFLALTDAKILSVNPFLNWFWDISLMFPECNNHTFYEVSSFDQSIQDAVKKFGMSASNIRYTHNIIPQEDIFYSQDDILEAMLAEVETI